LSASAYSGFEKIVDLGDWWKRQTGLPLPLGGNVLRKDIPVPVRRDLSKIIREKKLTLYFSAIRHSPGQLSLEKRERQRSSRKLGLLSRQTLKQRLA